MKGIFPSVVIAEYKHYLLGERIGWGTTEFLCGQTPDSERK